MKDYYIDPKRPPNRWGIVHTEEEGEIDAGASKRSGPREQVLLFEGRRAARVHGGDGLHAGVSREGQHAILKIGINLVMRTEHVNIAATHAA